ncbi:hypothetical protein NC651_001292 [Populus alba x Populus x berolinensis]|nr:hypothetical protein NC651_001292 [Populus alba x Populus x berolinensis]
MASGALASNALLLSLYILFLALLSSAEYCPPSPNSNSPPPPPPKVRSPPPPPKFKSPPPPPKVKSPPPPPPKSPPPPKVKSPPPPPPMVKSPPPPPMFKSPPPPPPSLPKGTCPRDTLNLIDGLVDLDAAICLCTRIKVDLSGLIKLDVPVAVELLLNECDRKVAKDFKCPPS